MIYPRTLKSEWYKADVYDTINASLEGTKQWTKYYYENKCERDAYVATFERCQSIVKYCDLYPEHALKALSDLHTQLSEEPQWEPYFSKARWLYKPNEARIKAVTIAFELVDGISRRYLEP